MPNPLIPPPTNLQTDQPPMNALIPPMPPTSPAMGFQLWASDPQNAHKVVPSMTDANAPLQPNHPSNGGMAAATPPKPMPMAVTAPPAVQMPSAPPQLAQDQQKLRDLQQSGAGLNQIKNPLLHGLAKAGDIIAPFLIGGGAAAIPGTTLHNRYLQRETENNIANEQAAYKDAQQTALNQADLNEKNIQTQLAPQNADAKRTAMLGALAKQGLKLDDNGMPVVDTESPAYQKQQLQNDLLTAQTEEKRAKVEVDQANAALQQAKTAGMDPNSPQFKLLLLKAQTAQQNANAAGERAKAYWGRYLQSAYNTGLNGDVLPGAMITDSGQVVGTGNAQNVRPTGTQRSKGNMAESADQQIQDMENIVAKRPDIFGPAAGRTTDFQTWLGSQDPDAQRFRAARTIAGDHLAGTFGGRSEAALSALDNAIGRFRDNPAAVKAGLDQLREANQLFLKAGTVRTVGSKNQGNFSSNNPLVPPKAGPKGNSGTPKIKPGTVEDGYRFKGGDPSQKENWEAVQVKR